MKTRNRVIVLLAAIGIVLFGYVQFVVIPHNEERKNQYIIEQQNPTTHDLNSILKYKNKYMGDASNISGLFHMLPLSSTQMTFESFPDKLTVEINYKDSTENIGEDKLRKSLVYNSTAAFALIDNLQGINYVFRNNTYKVSRSDFRKWYGMEVSNLLRRDKWKLEVQNKLKDNNYVDECSKAVLKKQ